MSHATPLRLHDTLSGNKKPFVTLEAGKAGVYVCGPTVDNGAHLGHARCYVVYDVLIRHLRALDLDVTYVRNVTDVNESITKRAVAAGEKPSERALRVTGEFLEDLRRLGCATPDIQPRVSEHMPQIITMIEELVAKGHAYESEGDVYFSVESFPEYGKLSHRSLEQMKAGASERLDPNLTQRKRHPFDFALWKSDESEYAWPSPWGLGQPGWHIECSAMSRTHLGATVDLHGGGLDLVFPHHENEIAQSEAANGTCFCNHWIHNGFVEVDKTKMSKSLGNFFTARELFDRIEPEALRLFVLGVHYRSPLNLEWTIDEEGQVTGFPLIEETERRLEYLYATRRRVQSLPEARISTTDSQVPREIGELSAGITEALNDDLNTAIAVAKMVEFLKSANEACDRALAKKGSMSANVRDAINSAFEVLASHLGVGLHDADVILRRIRDRRAASLGIAPETVTQAIADRAAARAAKDFAKSDSIRNQLASQGIELLDSADGQTDWAIR